MTGAERHAQATERGRRINALDEAQKPVGSVNVLASEEEPQHVPVSLGIPKPVVPDNDFDDEPLPARTCAIDGEECESCQ